ncbi:MAG: endonuclease/exonuclease/phosphatase family protein [Verrucomicrobiota bacterium]
MKFRILSLCVLSGLVSLAGCQKSRALAPPKAVAVREDGVIALNLMSFNIRYENPEDLDSRSWRQRLSGAVRMIRRERPDVIGVQEALHGQAADLWASLPDYEFIGIGRDDGLRAGEYSGIFYRKDRFRADSNDQGTFWLSDTPSMPGSHTWGNEIPRVAAWIRLVDLATMRGFYVFNTHWDHRNQPSRERAALLIAQRIDGRKHADEPVALIGDFNSLESNPGIVYLTGAPGSVAGSPQSWDKGLIDVYQSLHPGEKSRRTLHFWSDSREGNVKVDHILVSRGAKIEAAEIISTDKPAVSDHFPVTARVLFPLTK